jgi:hypothetical protein
MFAQVPKIETEVIRFEEDFLLTYAWITVIRDNFGGVLCTGIVECWCTFHAEREDSTDNLGQINKREKYGRRNSYLYTPNEPK